MTDYLSYAGAAGSAVSMLTTLYFWFVRMRNEQPRLKPFVADKEFFLGLSRDNVRQIGINVSIIVANYSSLPNAILGARLWIRQKDGWLAVDNLTFDKQSPQPFNVAPLQTVLLRLNGTLSFPYRDEFEEGSKTMSNYLQALLAQPLEMKLQLRDLGDHSPTHVLTFSQEEAATQPGLRIAA
jgi:hypothetical protein